MANKLTKSIPSLILFVIIMAIGNYYEVNSTVTFTGALAVAFGVYIGISRKLQ